MVIENQQSVFYVTHVEAEGQLLKIWAQTDEKVVCAINRALEAIKEKWEYYEPSNNLSPGSIVPNARCCVRMGNALQRAKILSLRSDGMVLVQFIDYGNISYVPIRNISLLEGLSEARYLFSIPEAAFVFVLADVKPISSTWFDHVVKQIKSILINTEHYGVFKTINNVRMIKLTVMNEDFSHVLISRNMALYSPSCPNSVPSGNWRTPAAGQQNSITSQKMKSFKAVRLEIGSVHSVRISHVEEGPCKFSIQLLDTIPRLEEMMLRLNSLPPTPLQESPIAGTVCIARPSRSDQLRRVILNSPGEDSVRVYYADYGSHEVLPFNQIYQIPDEFVLPDIFSIIFTLNGIDGWNISQDMKDYFQGLVVGKDLKLRVCKGQMSPLTQYCDLFLQGKSIKDTLDENFSNGQEQSYNFVYQEPKGLQNGTRDVAIVSYVESVAKFFIQIESDLKFLDDTMEKIDRYSKAAVKLTAVQIHQNMPCIALYNADKKWYRASIVSCNAADKNKVRVFYVDFGNEEAVSVENLRGIPRELVTSLPKQAIRCRLNGFESESLDKELNRDFESLVWEERVGLTVLSYDSDNTAVVNLSDCRNMPNSMDGDIAEKLRKMKTLLQPNNNKNENVIAHHGQSEDKFHKNSENAQRCGMQNNRLEKDFTKHAGQNNRFARDVAPGSFSKSSSHVNDSNGAGKMEQQQQQQKSVNSRLDRSFGSDRDSDTRSRGSAGKKNVHEKRNDQSRIGHWNNEQLDDRRNADMSTSTPKPRSTKANSGDSCLSTKVESSATAAAEIPPANITVGATKNCIAVYYVDPTDFYVQLCPDNEDLFKMKDKVDSIYKENGGKALQAASIRAGLQCMARYSNDLEWYRAVVKSVENSCATVHFVDYGNTETVSFDKLKEIEADLAKLPAQAVHCKLFGANKANWSKEDSDTLANEIDNEQLEAEFVMKEDEIYSILLKKVALANDSIAYINELFVARGVDVVKERDALRNGKSSKAESSAFAPFDARWIEPKVELGRKYDVRLGWFVDPSRFYCQFECLQDAFRDMMNEMQIVYENYKPVSEPLQVGSSVVAVLPDDGVLYRAQVLGVNDDGRVQVQYIDYGDRNVIDAQGIYPVEKKLLQLPKLGIFCGLKDAAAELPLKSGSEQVNELFRAEKYQCVFHDVAESKYLISLENNGNDIAKALMGNKMAVVSDESFVERARIDINLLEGQTLKVKVSSVEGVKKFYVQLYTADANEAIIEGFMSEADPEVMPRFSRQELCLGAGCLVNRKGKWRRGVVVKFTNESSRVKFIDTGDDDVVALNSMLKLPGELSAMQNQAIECSIFDVPLSSKADEVLRKTVTGKDVKIFVERIENNSSLAVRLFDVNGNKIKVIESQNSERISPVCNLPILSSTHSVIATWMTSSASIWLQRKSAADLEEQLLQELYDYYSSVRDCVVPAEGELYAALSAADGNWYRVRACQVNDGEAVVRLIDYGNVESVPLGNFRALVPQFYSPHQLAIEVSLSVRVKGSVAEQLETLEPFFKGKELLATFYNVRRRWLVDLQQQADGERLSDRLKGLNAIAEEEAAADLGKLAEMRAGGKYDVRVTHVDSPSQLWLHRREEEEPLARLQRQIQSELAECEDWEGVPEEKSLCLAVYDGAWYRAEVLDADSDITTVRFVDYGNTDVLDSGLHRVKRLPDKWRALKRYALPCKLPIVPPSNAADDWSGEACKRLADLVVSGGGPVRAVVVAHDRSPMHVDLLLNSDGESVCKTLVEERLAEYAKSHEELEEQIVEEAALDPRSAFVSHAISVDQFWMQEEKSVVYLEMMEDRLVMASMLKPLAEEMREAGASCVAHFHEDGKYYRARVISRGGDDGAALVRYIDYGNSAYSHDLKAIPEDLDIVQPLSRECRLAKPQGLAEWPKNVDAEFSKLADNGATVFLLDVLEESEPCCLVRLTHGSRDVACELVSLCAPDERPSPLGEEENGGNAAAAEVVRGTEKYDLKCGDLSYEAKLMKEKLASTEVIVIGSDEIAETKEQQRDKADQLGAPADADLQKLSATEDKIVPGCVSRGISVEEIARYSPVRQVVSTEEKIVPGSINKGHTLDDAVSIDDDDDDTDKCDAASTQRSDAIQAPQTRGASIHHDERVVPSCISRGETPIHFERPTTPKIVHDEKLVAGVVNLPNEDDEIISVERDIPQA